MSDDAAGNTRAGVAGWLCFEIVGLCMNDYRAPNHRALVVCQRDLMVHIFQLRLPRRICLHVSHIANMPFGRVRSCMRFGAWIKMSASRIRIWRGAIAKLMDMKAMIAGSQAVDFRPDLHPIGRFGERYGAAHFVSRGRVKHRDRFQGSGRFFFWRLSLRSEAADA